MKTLIIYATKNGSVKEVAQLIKKELLGEVKIVDAREDTLKDISEFDNILIGSSIYFGQINAKIKKFIFIHRPEIIHRKFGIFLMAGETKDELMKKQLKSAIPNDIFINAQIISVIGSEVKLKKFSMLVRFILKNFRKVKTSYKDIDKEKIKEFVEKFNPKTVDLLE